MLRSLFSAISGLQAHQTKMDVVGNNIANVNTVGYKSSTTEFEDTLSQVLRNGSAPTATAAGTNPAQVGLGVRVGAISTNFQQGSAQSTGRSTDFMINGDGFFITSSGSQQLYTRAGSFDVDGNGRLHTPDGAILQGWMATNGTINTNGPIGPLSIPIGQVMAPQVTTNSTISGNLSADNPVQVQAQATVYDSLGAAHQVNYVLTPSATVPFNNQWTVTASDASGALTTTPASGLLTFNTATKKFSPTSFSFTPVAGTWPAAPSIAVDISGLTQFGGKDNLSVTQPVTGAGAALGTLESFSLGDDGVITGVYSNGLKQSIGQLAIATFANPGGLSKAGNSAFTEGNNSGTPSIGTAGSGGRGSLSAGALEMSNVDLAQEFTGLIIAQRGFQANSKVITTSDQILQDLVQMKQ
jgi:flagellar hook protein FlgE